MAFVVVPVIGIAPFWKLAPSAGESTSRVGARTAEIGTLTMYASVCSEFLPVSGSVAEILKSLRPRRSGTTWLQTPMLSAVAWSWWPAESLIVTVPCGIVVPRNVYSVVGLVRVADRGRRVGDGDGRRLREAQELDREVADEQERGRPS